MISAFDPADGDTRRWGWWRLYESYGRAIRSYAFAAKSGRMKREQLDQSFLRRCEIEVTATANDQLRWAQESAYGTSFPTETKRMRGGGWYFSAVQAFDLRQQRLDVRPPDTRPAAERVLSERIPEQRQNHDSPAPLPKGLPDRLGNRRQRHRDQV